MGAGEKIKNFFKGICKSLNPTRIYDRFLSWRARREEKRYNDLMDELDETAAELETLRHKLEYVGLATEAVNGDLDREPSRLISLEELGIESED